MGKRNSLTTHNGDSAPQRQHSVAEIESSSSDSSYRAIPQDEAEAEDAEKGEHRYSSTMSAASSVYHYPPKPKGTILQADAIKLSYVTACQECISSTTWQCIVVGLTVANGLVIGLETDYADLTRWDIVENAFVIAFLVEILLKIAAVGPRKYMKWSNPELGWNLFDVSIISAGVFDMVITFLKSLEKHDDEKRGGGGASFATIMRMFRLLRVLRLLRIVRYLKKLYLLVFGLMEAAKAVVWITILMSFVLYVCSILLVHTVGRLPEDSPHADFLVQRFGTVEAAMLTLFQFMSSPTLIEYEKGNLMSTYPWLIGFLVIWIIFGSFGIVAMLTGVISESIFDKNQMWMNEMRSEREDMHKEIKRWCRLQFDGVPHNEHMEASHADIASLLPACEQLAEQLGIEYTHHDIKKCIRFMDHDNSGGISYPEFAHTIVNMLEGDSAVGNQELKHSMHITLTYVEKVLNHVQAMQSDACANKRTSKKQEKGHDMAMKEMQKMCSDVSQIMDTQRENVRSISELSIAVASTLQSMSDFVADMKRKDEANLLPIAAMDRCESPKEIFKKSLKASCEDLTMDLSTKVARIDAVLSSLGCAQNEVHESVGGSSQMSFGSDPMMGLGDVSSDANVSKSVATTVQREVDDYGREIIDS